MRAGLVIYELGLLAMLRVISLHLTARDCCPGSRLRPGYRLRARAADQRRASEIPPDGSGVASGANTTVRQVGAAPGVAVIGTVLTVQTVNHAIQHVKASSPVERTQGAGHRRHPQRRLGYTPLRVSATPRPTSCAPRSSRASCTAPSRAVVFALIVVGSARCSRCSSPTPWRSAGCSSARGRRLRTGRAARRGSRAAPRGRVSPGDDRRFAGVGAVVEQSGARRPVAEQREIEEVDRRPRRGSVVR